MHHISSPTLTHSNTDTGSPVTIVTPALSDGAALFDHETNTDQQSQTPQPLQTLGADGLITTLQPKLAHGVFLGADTDKGMAGISRARCTLYRGDLPMMRAVGGMTEAALIGLK